MKKLMALPLLLVLLVSFSAQAKPGKPHWDWWKSEEMTSQLDLSDEQKTQLEEIAAKYEPALKEARENLMTKKTAYKEAKLNKSTSNADVIKAFDVMWDAKYKMKRISLDRKLEMRDVLTQEQLTKLSEIKQAHRDMMKQKFEGHHQGMKEQSPQQ